MAEFNEIIYINIKIMKNIKAAIQHLRRIKKCFSDNINLNKYVLISYHMDCGDHYH